MLEVWGRKSSSNVQALMWCIGELGLPYQRHDVGHRFGGTDSDEFYALNPNRTIPVLRDGDLPPLWETGAILRYLANRYAPDEFWPADLIARTHVDRWMEWSKLNVALLFTAPIFWRVVRTPAAERDPAAIGQALQAFENKLMIAEPLLAGQTFLAGDTFSAADIQFGHVLYRYYDIDIDRQPLPNLRSYYDRLTERPAFREHVMVSYEELRA
ncbi:Glutathione S-transferase GstB [Serratia rubidaea]|uniref:Glutathione S-transferase GstB n=1 Tax=Serratia rubidaea TaxID=61652 RepID=A0A4U9HRM0_SERRU|nr:glutathione S-transferase family protein [Serratia rubidaea]MBD8455098.1 glutathione S-transferase family protein [Serratia rubidaea]MBS0972080.1 glutathione S-transferase family protein [Serratia rubidaea]MCR0997308.1 glutathione S-transferase family protein [Serratia rubidaea]MDC6109515.1 glutathione S-transferase family protein [Serratia rubidaea]QPR64082.1 glutathione S-transferase family protein [Serratia rubidaea]